jgi:L-alanine-DL-glutamate epimerase-like enolase superfamily enzyme
MLYDCMLSGGPSEWLKVAAFCSAFDIPMAPRRGPNTRARPVAAVPNGSYAEHFPNPADYDSEEELHPVSCDLMREAFSAFPDVIDGGMALSDAPAWGFGLDEDVVAAREIEG